VSIIALGCFHPVVKVQRASVYFFLGSDEEKEDGSDAEDVRCSPFHRNLLSELCRSPISEPCTIAEKSTKRHAAPIKSCNGNSILPRRCAVLYYIRCSPVDILQKRYNKSDSSTPNFAALQLLNDPQTFAEKLYDILHRFDKRFSLDHKILIMQLLSRVIGAHKLCLLGFYTYIIKYLTYHQLRVPAILVALAQSVHDSTLPDAVAPAIRKIAHEFVHPGVGSEVIAAGLNAIREVCKRQPWSIEEDLLGDLVEYRKSKDKAVTSAARGLLQLYREVNPDLLKRRERVSCLFSGNSIAYLRIG
jgi:protein SDA1